MNQRLLSSLNAHYQRRFRARWSSARSPWALHLIASCAFLWARCTSPRPRRGCKRLSAVEARGVVPQYSLVVAINGVTLRGYLDADVVVHLHVALGSGAKNARRVQLEDEPGLSPSERAARGPGLASMCTVNFIVTLRLSEEEFLSLLPLGRALRHNY